VDLPVAEDLPLPGPAALAAQPIPPSCAAAVGLDAPAGAALRERVEVGVPRPPRRCDRVGRHEQLGSGHRRHFPSAEAAPASNPAS